MTSYLFSDLDPISALPGELEDALKKAGHPKFRGKQIFSWIQNHSVADPLMMTNLPKDLQEILLNSGLEWPSRIGEVLLSEDGTRKLEVLLKNDHTVETVLIPDGDKLTQCVSSQVGCAVGCTFCRSGCFGLKRNLDAAEIISQVHLAKTHHKEGERLRNVVFMGIGEPLHNLRAVIRAADLMCHPDGLDLSTRRVTLSTVGIVRGIEKLAAETEGRIALAVSLHASDDQTRSKLIPGAPDSLKDIVQALKNYPLPPRRRFTIEYVLVKGLNDSKKDASELVKLLSRIRCKINLLPLNTHDKTDMLPPDEADIIAFKKTLTDKGLSVFLRKRRGADIGAACGQLLSMGQES
jgi:23S rRNA (adenine2503-C2)-methyltransferase